MNVFREENEGNTLEIEAAKEDDNNIMDTAVADADPDGDEGDETVAFKNINSDGNEHKDKDEKGDEDPPGAPDEEKLDSSDDSDIMDMYENHETAGVLMLEDKQEC